MPRRLAWAEPSRVMFTSPRRLRLYDGLVAFWVALWLVVGGWIGLRIWQFAEVADSVADSGRAISSAGSVIAAFGDVPVIGQVPGQLGARIEATGRSVAAQGAANADRTRQTAILLGLAIALAPSVPIAALYFVSRRGYVRDANAVVQAYRVEPSATDSLLALRAVLNQPYEQLRGVLPAPYTAYREGNVRQLADAEIERLGLHRDGT